MNGDGNAETEHDAVEITQQLINGQQPNIPTILQLSEADTPPQNAVDALQQTSGWIIERVGEHSTQLAIELLVKWGPLHDDESDWAEFAQLPTWNLRILVKDCWKDAQIVQNGEHH